MKIAGYCGYFQHCESSSPLAADGGNQSNSNKTPCVISDHNNTHSDLLTASHAAP